MLRILSHKLNFGLLLLFIALVFYASIGFVIEINPTVDETLSIQRDAALVTVVQTSPPARTALASP